jgi:hypothetical protein
VADTGGRSLEELVARIEATVLPHGFEVETRVKLYDDGGQQTAELDVRILGKLGSSSVHWVFECRDRPSSGPEGISWIEQLASRRERIGADKLFAVSTTGFSSEATRFAAEKAITLRTVSSIEDVTQDFKVESAIFHHSYISHIGLIDVRTLDPAPTRTIQLGTDTKIRFTGDKHWLTIGELLDSVTQDLGPDIGKTQPPIPDDSAGGARQERQRFFMTERATELRLADEIVPLRRIKIPYTFVTETLRSRAVAARLYAEGEREIGREGDFEFQSALGPIRARAQLFPNEDGTLRLNFAIDEKTSTARFQRVVIWGVND